MQIFQYLLVIVVIFALVNPTEAWRTRRLRKRIKKIGKSIKKRVDLKKIGCKALFGFGCKIGVNAATAAIAAKSGGAAATGAIIGGKLVKDRCRKRKQRCKRSVISDEIMVPFSDDFSDYDENKDGRISYEEFAFSIMVSVDMIYPEELKEPFMYADLDDDDHLTVEEFEAAPFLFAHVERPTPMPIFNSTTTNPVTSPGVEETQGFFNQTQSIPVIPGPL